MAQPLLQAQGLTKSFERRGSRGGRQSIVAVENVDLQLYAGETLGLVGESGCGKSTLSRLLSGLLPLDKGRICYKGQSLTELSRKQRRQHTRDLQMIFQDPFGSLNPKWRVGAILEEPLRLQQPRLSKNQRQQQVNHLLTEVGLLPEHARRFPHEFSGGQRQRIGIARTLAVRPKVLIADEPVTALDLSIQAQILNLLTRLQQQYQLSYLFIAHDLAVVAHMSDRIAVMYLGLIVEQAPAAQLIHQPRHPYTRLLLDSLPRSGAPLTEEAPVHQEEVPVTGCPFYPRCPQGTAACRHNKPPLTAGTAGHWVACYHPLGPAE